MNDPKSVAEPSESETLSWLRNEHAKLVRKVDALEAIHAFVRNDSVVHPRDVERLAKLLESYDTAVRGCCPHPFADHEKMFDAAGGVAGLGRCCIVDCECGKEVL